MGTEDTLRESLDIEGSPKVGPLEDDSIESSNRRGRIYGCRRKSKSAIFSIPSEESVSGRREW